MDHVEPFQLSTSVWSTEAFTNAPTAVHDDGPVHDTPSRNWDCEGEVSGLVTMDQATPFHASTRVWLVPATLWTPTAVHDDGLVHDTAWRTLSVDGELSGLGTIDHTAPFQVSTSVCVAEPL